MNLPAFMNNGRWLIRCLKCSTPLRVWNAQGVVCPVCHPGIMAKALLPIKNGLMRPVPDTEIVDAARREAALANEEYFPEYPAERSQIEEILRMRPARSNMNWIPGETLEILREQNIAHGDPVP